MQKVAVNKQNKGFKKAGERKQRQIVDLTPTPFKCSCEMQTSYWTFKKVRVGPAPWESTKNPWDTGALRSGSDHLSLSGSIWQVIYYLWTCVPNSKMTRKSLLYRFSCKPWQLGFWLQGWRSSALLQRKAPICPGHPIQGQRCQKPLLWTQVSVLTAEMKLHTLVYPQGQGAEPIVELFDLSIKLIILARASLPMTVKSKWEQIPQEAHIPLPAPALQLFTEASDEFIQITKPVALVV